MAIADPHWDAVDLKIQTLKDQADMGVCEETVL